MSTNSEKRQAIIAAVSIHEQFEAMQDQIDLLTAEVEKGKPGTVTAPKYAAMVGRIADAKAKSKK